jgi:hypothetical protein
MKNGIGSFLFVLINFSLYGINISIEDLYTSILIDDGMMEVVYYYSGNFITEKYSVQWDTSNKINYINFYYDGNFLGEKIQHGQKRYLVLHNGYLIFYNSQNRAEYYLCGFRYESDLSSFSGIEITASSELKEEGSVYPASNMLDKGRISPWSEGAPGNGIGQTVKISFELQPLVFGLGGFYISNGYVDYNKPYLYEYNNRIKRIRVSYSGSNEYREFELEDNPNFQYIHLDIGFKPTIVMLEILEVYPGSRWEDACINALIPIGY